MDGRQNQFHWTGEQRHRQKVGEEGGTEGERLKGRMDEGKGERGMEGGMERWKRVEGGRIDGRNEKG